MTDQSQRVTVVAGRLPRIADYDGARDNNFNLLRLLAAVVVVYSHSFLMSLGYARVVLDPDSQGLFLRLTGITSGRVAVNAFFVMSGFLLARSLAMKGSVTAFIVGRSLRIYPGLIVCVLLTVLVMGPLLTTVPLREYLGSHDVLRYIALNASLLWFRVAHHLPGVFGDNPYPHEINGSLWTLPWEIGMYVALLAGSVLGLLRRRWVVLLLWAVSVHFFARWYQSGANNANAWLMFEQFFSFFFGGSVLYLYRAVIPMSLSLVATAAVAWIVIAFSMGSAPVLYYLYPPLLAYAVVGLALVPAGPVRAFNRLPDLSYGTYIYAFPIQQIVVSLSPGIPPMGVFAWSMVCTLGMAAVSWYCIERPALDAKGAVTRALLTQTSRVAARLGLRSSISTARAGPRGVQPPE
ncbi:MAG TPA: acyltransferase [Solimonas sp.]|nr:acyltransferase [Solimonas sp.]